MSSDDSQRPVKILKAIKLESPQTTTGPFKWSKNEHPVIPLHIIDAPTQRYYAVASLILLQGIKLFYIMDNALFSHFTASSQIFGYAFWSILDILLIFAVSKLKIPWFQFPSNIWLGSALIILTVNLFLVFKLSEIFSPLFFFFKIFNSQPEPEKTINHRKTWSNQDIPANKLNDDHIIGKHIIKFLPDSSVKLNPHQDRFCFASNDVKKTIRVLINGTDPATLTYSFAPFHSKDEDRKSFGVNLKEFSKKHIVDEEKGTVYGTFDLNVEHPGYYNLLSVTDSQKRKFKIDRDFSNLMIPNCPNAKFPNNSVGKSENRCYSENNLVNYPVTVDGVPPLKLTYSMQLGNQQEKESVMEYLVPDTFDETSLNLNGIPFHAPHHFSVDIRAEFDSTGHYNYRIKKVEDALGNTQIYNSQPSSDSFIHKSINIHQTPQASFDCSKERPIFIKHETDGFSQKVLKLKLNGNYPYTINYGLKNLDSNDDSNWDQTFTKTIQNDQESFVIVDQPGIYELISVKDKFCSNNFIQNERCPILLSKKPSVQFNSEPIESSCAGKSGVKLDILFSGEPEFTIYYQQTRKPLEGSGDQEVFKGTIDASTLRHQYIISPDTPGRYEFVFFKMNDANYRDVPISYSFEQEIHPIPQLHLLQEPNTKIRSCTNETIKVPLQILGSKPFNLKYVIRSPFEVKQYTMKNLDNFPFNFALDQIKAAGKYHVEFTSIEDSKKCKINIKNTYVDIDATSMRPTAKFNCMSRDIHGSLVRGRIFSSEGAYGMLPIKFQGEPPYEVKYTFESSISKSVEQKTILITNAKDYSLNVNEPGTYTITEVTDNYCSNSNFSDNETDTCVFEYYPKPTLKLITPDNTSELQSVCQNHPSLFEVEFSGRSPYTFDYRILHSKSSKSGHFGLLEKKKIESVNHKYKIDTLATVPGQYEYQFTHISDLIYSGLPLESNYVVKQTVHAHPDVSFIQSPVSAFSKESQNRQCVNTILGDPSNPIKVALKGSPSFQLTAELTHQHGTAETLPFFNITENTFALNHPKKLLNPGTYTLDLTKVVDENECEYRPTRNNRFKFQVDPVAKLNASPSSSIHYCVGDSMSFSLAGTPPWYVTYSLNGKQEILDDLRSSTLRRFADKEGVLQIHKVCNVQKDHCCTDYENEQNHLKYYIHPIPSAIMSEGKIVQKHIHDGDSEIIKIDFVGTPPFTFMYTRSDPYSNKILETRTISKVDSNQYELLAREEGIFEIIYIADQYCEFPRSQ